MGRSFLKCLGGSKIHNQFIIRLLKALGKSYNHRINKLGF